MGRVPNAMIREFCGVTKGLNERVDEGVLRWFGHVERRENDRFAKRIYVGKLRKFFARSLSYKGVVGGSVRAPEGVEIFMQKELTKRSLRAAVTVVRRSTLEEREGMRDRIRMLVGQKEL